MMNNYLTISNKSKRTLAIVALIALLFGAGVLVGAAMSDSRNVEPADGKLDSPLLKEVQESLNNKFVFWKSSTTLPTAKQLEYGMIEGYVATYKDPYTVFFPPKEAKSFTENVQGSFGGVGMHVGMKEGNVVVIAPLKDSPAMKAGIRAGDIIAAIDDKNALGMSSDEAVSLIRGEVGTTVKLTVLHPDAKSTTDIVIKRDTIKIPTIDTEKKGGVFIIRLYNFSAESPQLFQNALKEFVESGYRRMVIDLRGNPGGYLDAAVSMASFFLSEGKVVVSEKQGKDETVVNHRSLGYSGLPADMKVAVLVDGGSASASEILAGALKDHGMAKVVGQKTFGKGSVQELVNFDDGSALKVTIAKWFTPAGVNISESGIKPDIEVAAATSTPKKDKKGNDIDIQMEKAIEVVKSMK